MNINNNIGFLYIIIKMNINNNIDLLFNNKININYKY